MSSPPHVTAPETEVGPRAPHLPIQMEWTVGTEGCSCMHSSPPGTEQPRPYAPPLKPACAECVHRAPWEVRRAPQDSSLASTVCPCGVPPRPQGCPASRSAPLVPPADAQAFDHTNVPHAPAPNHRTAQHSALIRTRASHPTASPLHPLPPATPTHDVCPREMRRGRCCSLSLSAHALAGA